jgi:DNA-binding response OmpR family regulator
VSHGPGSILVVEDDPSLRMVCSVALELEGFTVREAASLAEARAQVAAERPTLVLLDLRLGGGSSEELLDELMSAGLPVVVVSGAPELDELARRASAVLAKPFDPDELVAVARAHALG